jgi:hypothetical protein
MGDVKSLHGAQVQDGTPNQGCVDKLRDLLERAEAGEITGIALAALHSDNTASSCVAGMIGPSALLGQLRMAEHDLIAHMDAVRKL